MIRKSIADLTCQNRYKSTMKISGMFGGTFCATEKTIAQIKIDEICEPFELYIVPDKMLSTDILLGENLINNKNVIASINAGCIKFKYVPKQSAPEILNEMKINHENCETINVLNKNDIIENESNENKVIENETNKIKSSENKPTELKENELIVNKSNATKLKCGINDNDANKKLNELFVKYRDVFSENVYEIGKTDKISMSIELNSNVVVSQKPYRVPEPKKEILSKLINELLVNDIIQESDSEYASPVLLNKKKTGDYRMCVDYRQLNAITRKENYPMPNIEEQLHEAARYKYFTTLDLNCGYYQVPISPESQKYTAFVTPDGHYEFRRMPFGLRNAPSVFQRLMAKIKKQTNQDDMIIYMDDILVGSVTIDEMFEKLQRIFEILREAKLTLKLEKCEFIKESITYLGHELTFHGISPGEIKVAAINNFATPACVTDVRKFLGLSGYFRKFVPGFALISEPLRKLLRQNQDFVWGEEQNNAFLKLKTALVSKPVMTS